MFDICETKQNFSSILWEKHDFPSSFRKFQENSELFCFDEKLFRRRWVTIYAKIRKLNQNACFSQKENSQLQPLCRRSHSFFKKGCPRGYGHGLWGWGLGLSSPFRSLFLYLPLSVSCRKQEIVKELRGWIMGLGMSMDMGRAVATFPSLSLL